MIQSLQPSVGLILIFLVTFSAFTFSLEPQPLPLQTRDLNLQSIVEDCGCELSVKAVTQRIGLQECNQHHSACLEALARWKRQPLSKLPQSMVFSMFWSGEEMPQMTVLSIMSILASQPSGTTIHLWLTRTLSPADLPAILQPFLSRGLLQLHHFASDHPSLYPALLSDYFRFWVLSRTPGFYVDTDVVVLRTFAPLLKLMVEEDIDFAYRWSTQAYANTAVLGMRSRSKLFQLLDEHGFSAFYPSVMTKICAQDPSGVCPRAFKLLPSTFFDPLWLRQDDAADGWCGLNAFTDFFSRFHGNPHTLLRCMLSGPFAHHTHKSGASTCEPSSPARILSDHISRFIQKRFNVSETICQ